MISKKYLKIFLVILICNFGVINAQNTEITNLQVLSTDSFDGSETTTRSSGGGGSGGGNPGAMMMILQAQQQAELEKQNTAQLEATSTAEPRPVETNPNPVEDVSQPEPEVVVETISEALPAGDLSASTESLPINPKAVAVAVGAIAIISFAGFQLNARNTPENQAKRKGKRCMHVGAIIEANLKEMTSLEERVEDMLKDKLQSKKAAKLVKILKKLKDKHEKFSKLFEDCVVKKDDKKKVVTIHSDDSEETKAWTNQFGQKAKTMGFEHESMHISNPKAMDIISKAGKNTMFVLHGDTSHAVAESIKSSGKGHIASNDINEVVEKLKGF